jgi:hypothetical protein
LTLCNSSSFLTQTISNCSSPSFSSTIFQNFPCVSDPLSEMSKFQQCSKCSISLVASLNTGRNIRRVSLFSAHF